MELPLNIFVIVKPVTVNSFVTTNERSLFGRMRPVHGTLDACNQSAARRSLSYVTRALELLELIYNLYSDQKDKSVRVAVSPLQSCILYIKYERICFKFSHILCYEYSFFNFDFSKFEIFFFIIKVHP